MLNFGKLMPQIAEVGQESVNELDSQEARLLAAQETFDEATENPDSFAVRMVDNVDHAQWPLSIPLEPISTQKSVQPLASPHTVVACDGSQILPSHHEVYSCYLLNIGSALITYGTLQPPILESQPHLYHRPHELYPLINGRRMHVDEQFVALERNLLELEQVCQRAIAARERLQPVVAFVDGSLIPWGMHDMPLPYQTEFTVRIIGALERLRQYQVPIVGYISHSRSSDLTNDLRVWRCPYPKARCRDHCGSLNEEEYPCSSLWPMTDRQLLMAALPKHRRTCVFKSSAAALDAFPLPEKTCFAYLNVGHEVARLEFPHWVFADSKYFELMLSATLTQADKGMGYPVALSEAHNLAVIRASDRSKFFDLLTKHLVSLGVGKVRVSPKESRKRRSII